MASPMMATPDVASTGLMDPTQIAPQAPTNPFKPQSGLSVPEMIAQYRAGVEVAISGSPDVSGGSDESMPDNNPWDGDEINPTKLKQGERDHQAWLDTRPISVQSRTTFDNQTHLNILRNMEADPLTKELFGDETNPGPLTQLGDQIADLVQSGHITSMEQIKQIISEAIPHMDETAQRHIYGEGGFNNDHLLTVNPDLHQMPKMVKKLKGGNK